MNFIWIRLFVGAGIIASVSFGCAHHAGHMSSSAPAFSEPPPAPAPANASQPKLIVSPEQALIGTVSKVNAVGRYVVLTFPLGRMPALQQQFSVYRQGMKVGEVRVTGPQLDDNIVADILSGEASSGDEARDR